MVAKGESELVSRRTREASALRFARQAHLGQSDRYGAPFIAHVERVASRVAPSARAVALVHDVCERADASPTEVALMIGLDDDERDALALLTRRHRESLSEHVARIVQSPRGPDRELALVVKRVDVEDDMQRSDPPPTQFVRALKLLASAMTTPTSSTAAKSES